ncbi:hypothetical protein [Sabulicella rubraurantiaca]|uniref:hypothetical protein n=1 Tax=Sabulicella rubraurantiaca TaxID=2811429 RepID=UPI001A96F419|nr:hypothetical protein [Sabulicella rubraurantiaca]
MKPVFFLLPLLALTGPAAAQSGEGALVCVYNEGAYVARATFDGQTSGGTWERVGSSGSITLDSQNCRRFSTRYVRTRTTVEGHTGFNWRQTCRHEFAGTQSVRITAKGTTLNQSCTVF